MLLIWVVGGCSGKKRKSRIERKLSAIVDSLKHIEEMIEQRPLAIMVPEGESGLKASSETDVEEKPWFDSLMTSLVPQFIIFHKTNN